MFSDVIKIQLLPIVLCNIGLARFRIVRGMGFGKFISDPGRDISDRIIAHAAGLRAGQAGVAFLYIIAADSVGRVG